MTANETRLQDIISGDRQFVIPLFQRVYSWEKRQWEMLWNDIIELSDSNEATESQREEPRTHFMGSIVNFPTVSVPEGVAKFLLIDGQQRLTTILLLLIAIRDVAKNSNDEDEKTLAEEIHQKYVINNFKKGNDYYKVLPTQGDRENFQKLVQAKEYNQENKGRILLGYEYFLGKIKKTTHKTLANLKETVTSKLSLVSITLGKEDNPYLVFESLNSKGEPLSPADLIRNHFFMCIHVDKQDDVFQEEWKPMQDNLEQNLTDFIKHFLMRDGGFIKQNDIYITLKNKVKTSNALEKLQELSKFSFYYQRLLQPEFEPNKDIQKYLKRLNRLDVTTCYPLLLNFYNIYDEKLLSSNQFVEILQVLENYLIRRAICNIPSNQLNKIFPELFKQIERDYPNDFVFGLKSILQTKGYPKDIDFLENLQKIKFYGGSPLNSRTQLILESIEESFGHREIINFETTKTSIEHIMPRHPDEDWRKELGEDWQLIHESYVDDLGNLTLTAIGYNSEMSNNSFYIKKKTLKESHLELNRYFDDIKVWNKDEIEKRSEYLAKKCLEIWSYFGITNEPVTNSDDITGKTPTGLWILSQNFQVQSWRDVLENTLNVIAELEPEKFEVIAQKYPRFLSLDENKFKNSRKQKNGYFFEVKLSAKDIHKFCLSAIREIDLTDDDWKVSTL
jgi:uncharacterized protein with ParB-like and HNH nuclease domain